jgi:retron-type reverse transcriptase
VDVLRLGTDVQYPEKGTPQGGVISPLLSNIYLHEVLDKWFAETVKPLMKGKTFMVRYADDAIIGCETKEDADRIMKGKSASVCQIRADLGL